eukprot:scaffold4278_cov263-Pinguiococcus_pyrenoidosus.AAC.9
MQRRGKPAGQTRAFGVADRYDAKKAEDIPVLHSRVQYSNWSCTTLVHRSTFMLRGVPGERSCALRWWHQNLMGAPDWSPSGDTIPLIDGPGSILRQRSA